MEQLADEIKTSFRRVFNFVGGFLCIFCKFIEFDGLFSGEPLEKHLRSAEHLQAKSILKPPENKLPKGIQTHDIDERITYVNGSEKVYCGLCRENIDGKTANVRAHIGNDRHQRRLRGDFRTRKQVNLDKQIENHPYLSLSADYQYVDCIACKNHIKIRDGCTIKDHLKSASHKSYLQHRESKTLHAMKMKAQKYQCFEVLGNDGAYNFHCTVCTKFLKGSEERVMQNHLNSKAHLYNVVDERGETIPDYHRNLTLAFTAG